MKNQNQVTNHDEVIILFKDEYNWLSNFYPCTIEYGQFKFHSVEHAYVSEKCDDYKWKEKCADKSITTGQIKRAGRRVPIRPNFEFEKVKIMESLLRIKFQKEYLREKLIATYPKVLVEGNYHGDTFWGYCLKTNNGQNKLGILLMKLRDEFLGINVKTKKTLKDFAK